MIRNLCLALVEANRLILRAGSVPPLMLSGVRYRPEPRNWTVERFDNAQTCLDRGWGDCDDLASWQCAELLEQGIPATIIVMWKPTPEGRLYHIQVRVINPACKANHSHSLKGCSCVRKDPSAALGMKGVTRNGARA